MALVCFLTFFIRVECCSIGQLNPILKQMLQLRLEFYLEAFTKLVDSVHLQ